MKIWYGSDLHVEWWMVGMTIFDHIWNWKTFDYFIFAGDIGEWKVGKGEENDHMKLVIRPLLDAGKQVLLIPGNHEYYFGDLDEVNEDMEAFFKNVPGATFLQYGMMHSIPGVVDIIGGTFWTDVFKGNKIAGKYMQSRMNDRKNITKDMRLFSYKDMISENSLMLNNIKMHFEEGRVQGGDVPVIVVSHHAPSAKSIHPSYIKPHTLDSRERYLNAGYVSCHDDFIKSFPITYWIHGHIHYVWDYMIGNTRMLCNPLGYLGVSFEDSNNCLGNVLIEV